MAFEENRSRGRGRIKQACVRKHDKSWRMKKKTTREEGAEWDKETEHEEVQRKWDHSQEDEQRRLVHKEENKMRKAEKEREDRIIKPSEKSVEPG